MTALIVALLVTQTPANWFDQSLAAHKSLKSFSAHAVVSGQASSSREKTTIDLSVAGNDLLFDFQAPAKPGQDRTDLIFEMRGSSLIGYDRVANERLQRKVNATGSKLTRLESGMGQVEEVAGTLLEPAKVKSLYTGLQKLGGWKGSAGPGVWKMVRTDKGKGSSRIVFDIKTKLLRELSLKNGKNELLWTIKYGPVRPINYPFPPNAKKVTSFTIGEAPPVFLSKAARSTYNSLLSAASRLKNATLVVTEDGTTTRSAFNNRSVRESQPRYAWAFSGKVLTMQAPSGTYYRGQCLQSDVIDIVGQLGGRVSPYVRNLLLRRVPFKNYFTSKDKFTLAGSVAIRGVKCQILRAENPGRRTSILVRMDNHLPLSITTDQLDGRGNTLGSSTQDYAFSATAPAQNALTLNVPTGKTPKALPQPKSPVG